MYVASSVVASLVVSSVSDCASPVKVSVSPVSSSVEASVHTLALSHVGIPTPVTPLEFNTGLEGEKLVCAEVPGWFSDIAKKGEMNYIFLQHSFTHRQFQTVCW